MQAVRIHSYGGPEVVRVGEAPQPELEAGQVLIRVRASAVNPVDSKIRSGGLAFLNHQFPLTLGCEVSGIVEIPAGGFRKGDEVYAFIALNRLGGFAEYAAAFEHEVALKPTSLDFTEAASIPVGALTSWQALFDTGKLEAGQTLLIHGAAGAVASFGAQLAKYEGARVIGTASRKNLGYLRELGVDEAIDYQTTHFEHRVNNVDLVYDAVGGDTLARSFAVVRKGGRIVSIAGMPSQDEARKYEIEVFHMAVKPNGPRLGEIAKLVDSGKITTRVGKVLPLAQASEAFDLSAKGQIPGKIVLEVNP